MRYSLRARTKLLTHEDTNDPPLKLKKKPEKGRKKIKKQTKRERLSKKMLAQKLRRAKIKLDPKLHEAQKMQERERWKRRRAAGKIKLIHDMTPREKRIVRMRRKISARKHSAKQLRTASEMTLSVVQQVATAEVVSSVVFQGPSLAEQQTPSISCYCAINKNTKNIKRANQKNALRKKKKNISKTYQRCVTLEKKFTNLQRTHWRLLKTQKKSEPLSDSPPSRINREFKGRQLDPITKKRLLFGEVLKDQIAESANNKSTKTKQAFYKLLSGKVIKKYRMLHMTKNMLSRPLLQKYMKNDDGLNYTRVSKIKVRHTEVKEFYARDDISSKCPDKKVYVISYKNGKMKKRKRILQGKLTDLYSKYSSECSQKNVKPLSYTVFCRLKPFFVVHQKASERDTCLCKYCENFTMKVEALHRISVIRESTPYKVMSAVTCNAQNDDCLIRKCVSCKDKSIDFSTEVSNETIVKYSEWDKNVDKKTVKVEKSSDLLMFKSIFLDSLITYQLHYFKQKHQHEVLKNKRENLADGEIYIHCDFSENYGCKYTKEIQPMYYGGNREEISIHTGVLYTKNKSYAFCTLSRNGRHDAPAIWAHLLKVFKHFMPKFCGISKVHIQSDSPTTQYRNKDYFFLTLTVLGISYPEITEIVHNYTEAGHGKGGPDGVGGWAKKAADDAVASGTDINTFSKLVNLLKDKSKKTFIDVVETNDIEAIDAILSGQKVDTFVGTMKVHQFTWHKENSFKLFLNEVSCYECPPGQHCIHFKMPNSPWEIPGAPQVEQDLDDLPPDVEPVKKGSWVVVTFGEHWYPGLVEKATKRNLTVNFMVKHEKRNDLFLWPGQSDIQIVKREDIILRLEQPPVPVDRSHFKVPQGNSILKT